MSSTSPPLPSPPCPFTPWRPLPQHCANEPLKINWPPVLVSVSVSFTLVAGIFAWIATHPHKTVPPHEAPRLAFVEAPTAPPTLPNAPVVAALPVFHPPSPRDTIANDTPLMDETPLRLLPPASARPKQQVDENSEVTPIEPQAPAGETYGTQVLFLNKRETAAKMARHDNKLLFVMHISGNFEDSCFT